MGIHNTDGTEAQACGNATRCLAFLLFEETGKTEVLIDSLGGPLHCRRDGAWQVSVTLGPITTDWQRVPLARAVDTAHLPLASGPLNDGVALSIGNPHAVFFVDGEVDIPAAAPAIARDPLFPESVNVGVAQVIDERTLKLAVWERPGMLTEACGTGACVAAFAGRLRGLLEGRRVHGAPSRRHAADPPARRRPRGDGGAGGVLLRGIRVDHPTPVPLPRCAGARNNEGFTTRAAVRPWSRW